MIREILAIIAVTTAFTGCDRPEASQIASVTLQYQNFLTCSYEEAAEPAGSGKIFKRRSNEVAFGATEDKDFGLNTQLAGSNIHTFGFEVAKVGSAFQIISSYRENGDNRTSFPNNDEALKSAKGTGNEDSFDLSLFAANGKEIASFTYEAELITDEDELTSSSGVGLLAFAGKTYAMKCLYAQEVEL